MLNCLIDGQKPLKMDKIGHISVREFSSARFTNSYSVITFAFLFFSWNFQNQCNFLENFVIWPPNFSRDQNQNSLSDDVTPAPYVKKNPNSNTNMR